MSSPVYKLNPLKMDKSQIQEVLYVLINSILFQRDLGCSDQILRYSQLLNISYLSCDNVQNDKLVQEKLQELQDLLKRGAGLYYEINLNLFSKKQQFLLGMLQKKIPFEIWQILIEVTPKQFEMKSEEKKKQKHNKFCEEVKKRLFDIVMYVGESLENIPSYENQEIYNNSFSFEINFGKYEENLSQDYYQPYQYIDFRLSKNLLYHKPLANYQMYQSISFSLVSINLKSIFKLKMIIKSFKCLLFKYMIVQKFLKQ